MERWESDETFLSRWINNEVTPEEKEEFEASEVGKDYLEIVGLSDQLELVDYKARAEFEKLRNRIGNHPKPQRKSFWMQPTFRVAVAAIVVIALGLVFLIGESGTVVKTGYNEQELVNLPDGSIVRLNASSEISYDANGWDEKRLIKLEGEAFFEVKKGNDFVVETSEGKVKVLGTSFNVWQRDDWLEVICYTGKVNVSSRQVSSDLTKGDAIRLKDELIIKSWEIRETNQADWLSGIKKYEDVPLSVVLGELEQIFGIEVISEQNFENKNYNGAFPIDNVESAIKLVLEPFNISYSYDLDERKLVIEDVNP